jgi:hypothetical protein
MFKALGRLTQNKEDLLVCLRLKRLSCSMEESGYLQVVWERGAAKQPSDPIPVDGSEQDLDFVFKKASGFYKKDGSNSYEKKEAAVELRQVDEAGNLL